MSNPTPTNPKALGGGWSASGGMVQGNVNKQVTLQANFPLCNDYTIEFTIDNPNPKTDLSNITQAEITWSVNGNSVRRLVSVYNGLSVTGVGQAVRVVIHDLSVDNLGTLYNVHVNAAPGTRGSFQNPPILENPTGSVSPIFFVAPASNVVIPVPQNAGIIAVGILVASRAAPPVPIPDQAVQVFHNSPFSNLKLYDPREFYWVPLSPGTTNLQLFNNMVLPGQNVAFSVTFGIDG